METFAAYAPTIGLLFFFFVFVFIVVRTMRPSAKAKIESLAYLPLKEDNHG